MLTASISALNPVAIATGFESKTDGNNCKSVALQRFYSY